MIRLSRHKVRQIRARNRAFLALTPAKRRVAIAKDVIQQLNAEKIIAQRGVYFDESGIEKVMEQTYWAGKGATGVAGHGETQVCDLLETSKCTVCGIGAAFVSAVRLGDDLKIKDLAADETWVRDYQMRDYLKRYFDPPQVALIECAFERGPYYRTNMNQAPSKSDTRAAVAFGRKYDGDADRMRAIFQNIVSNRGTFRPSNAARVRARGKGGAS